MDQMRVHSRHMLKSKDIKTLKQKLDEEFGEENINELISKKTPIEQLILDNKEELIAINGTLCFWFSGGRYIPLMSLLINPEIHFAMKYVSVDKGAIPHVANGADIMRPGIKEIDPNIKKDDTIKIQDLQHGRALAVGISLYDAEEMEKMDKGRVIKNVHTVNDPIWKFSKEFTSGSS